MKRLDLSRAAALALAGALAVTPFAGTRAAPGARDTDGADRAVAVTERDVSASTEKARAAYGALVTMWSDGFARIGAEFARPGLARYRGTVRTSCGPMGPGNAGYCPRDNRIYFDEVFLAAQARRAAGALGTDGDMAAVGVIAHEMGHAVAIQLGYLSRFTYRNESTADCLAGAFTRQADADGSVEPGDVEEAYYGMATAGDPTPRLTGDGRVDRAILVRAALMGHGTDEQRTANFRRGLDGGPGACLPAFRGA
jgi:predicted metalloprotease